MNFLAHFHLAWPDEGLIAGGLEGDYHKGPVGGELDPGVARGIRLHRAIDAYTDEHPLIAELRRRFPPKLRRYAGILIDLSFDHYLTRHWSRFSELELQVFNGQVHTALSATEHALSEASRRMLGRLRDYDILNRYHDWRTVTASAERVGERFRRGNPLLAVEGELDTLRDEMEQVFLAFYPELKAFSEDKRQVLNQLR